MKKARVKDEYRQATLSQYLEHRNDPEPVRLRHGPAASTEGIGNGGRSVRRIVALNLGYGPIQTLVTLPLGDPL
jgi:hypothetical protein